jgi:ligand-binding sensor domain-containing protein
VLPISDGVIWMGTTNGVARLSSVDTEKGSFESTARARWQVFNEDDGLPGVVVEDLLEDNDGRIWAATDNGVAVFDGQSWRAFTTADGLADDQVNDMALGSDGSIWFATKRGASHYNGVTWHTFRRGDGLPATLEMFRGF